LVIGLSTQPVTLATVICRRHLPTWSTRGMLLPAGTPDSTKCPFTSVSAVAIGLPESATLHLSQETPSGTGSSGAFGT
jgi:hypothetical protein